MIKICIVVFEKLKKKKKILTVKKSSQMLLFLKFYYHSYVKSEGFIERRSSKKHTAVTGNAKKGPLNLSAKLEWVCLQHRQAWSRPQSPVKWESVETGQGWMLRWSSSVEHTYRECERPGTAEGGGQNQPVCTSTVLWEPVSSITTRPAKLTYPRN